MGHFKGRQARDTRPDCEGGGEAVSRASRRGHRRRRRDEGGGVTVGGFYKHFGSRDELVVEALATAFKDLDVWEEHTDGVPQLLAELFDGGTSRRAWKRLCDESVAGRHDSGE
jgi:AcrR family transcriptional regulator